MFHAVLIRSFAQFRIADRVLSAFMTVRESAAAQFDRIEFPFARIADAHERHALAGQKLRERNTHPFCSKGHRVLS